MVRIHARVAIAGIAALLACSSGDRGLQVRGEDCRTAGDEDGDGLADCGDPQCSGLVECRAQCGNGKPDLGEACDDGNPLDGDGCAHDCTISVCSNGARETGEACDDGNPLDGDGCDSNCTVTACGNDVVSAGEQCDDGNTVDGDGCNACRFASCPGAPAVEPGRGGSLPLPGQITRLITSPTSCFVYALAEASTSRISVISTASKKQIAQVTLQRTDDIAISPDGSQLVAAHAAARKISIIDTATWRVARTVPTQGEPTTIQVDDGGVAYYTSDSYSSSSLYRIELALGLEDYINSHFGVDLKLTSNGAFLYAGESQSTGSNLYKYEVGLATFAVADRTTYNDGYGFSNSDRHVYLSPGGQHIYYAGLQFDAAALNFFRGRTAQRILAEDVDASFAIGTTHVFDAQLVRPVVSLPHVVKVAVLAADDQELWYYSAFTLRLHYLNMSELIGGRTLGVRERAPLPLNGYRLVELIHDPVRRGSTASTASRPWWWSSTPTPCSRRGRSRSAARRAISMSTPPAPRCSSVTATSRASRGSRSTS